MPATTLPTRAPRRRSLQLALAVLSLVLLCSATAADPPAASARNWSSEIAAARSGQLYYESLMRTADAETRGLARARRQASRRVRSLARDLRTAVRARADARRRLADTRRQLASARVALAEPSYPPPPPPDASLAVQTLTQPQGAADSPAMVIAATVMPEVGRLALTAGGMPPLPLGPGVSVADVVSLERAARQQRRSFQKARQRARRVSRALRQRRGQLAAIKARQRSATARREGAEAALAGRIHAMSRLAQRRVAKKTSVRPGVNSGFTWPAAGRISQSYGCTGFRLNPARGSCRHFHDGIDIAGYRGAPIRSAAVGVVSYVGWNPWDEHGRAFIIVVAHPGGYETVYGHVLPTRRVRVGQLVRRGEVIGSMGNTGRSTGVHLHFEIRRGRVTLGPLAFL